LKIYTQKMKGKIMKIKNTVALALLALGTTALVASAQDSNNDGPPPGGGQGGPGMGGHRPPPPLIIAALDANHDGVIDADEIANASAALKSLDKNGDGKLTRDEYIGKRPMGRPPGGNDGGPGNNDGPKGPPPGDN
jgi:hypothetical protein